MQIFVVPTADLTVRDPNGKGVVPSAGMYVEDNSYWRRRALDGSVTIKTQKPPEAKPAKKTGGGD